MRWFLVLGVTAGAIALFFTWANRSTAKAAARSQPQGRRGGARRIRLPESPYHDTWDLFLAWPIDDPYLESVRQRCLTIVRLGAHFRCRASRMAAPSNLGGFG